MRSICTRSKTLLTISGSKGGLADPARLVKHTRQCLTIQTTYNLISII